MLALLTMLGLIPASHAAPDPEAWVALPSRAGVLEDASGDAPGADLAGEISWQADAREVSFRVPVAVDAVLGDVAVLVGASPELWDVALVAEDGLVVLRNDGTPGLAGGELVVASARPDGWAAVDGAVELTAFRGADLGALGEDARPLYVAVVAGVMADIVATGRGAWTDSTGCVGFCETLSEAASERLFIDGDLDGLTDPTESLLGTSTVDADSDDDGRLDGDEGAGDADGDGVPDALQCDADGDGLVDGLEAGVRSVDRHRDTDPSGCFVPDRDATSVTDPTVVDSDGGGLADGVEDVDRDGVYDPPWELDPTDPDDDADSDADGVPDAIEMAAADGVIDDEDSDGDGILDSDEGWADTDGDGWPDFTDADSDDDCLGDDVEGLADTDGDGTPDRRDDDSDGDDVSDADESDCAPYDTDGDQVPDHLDDDSDGDGIPDVTEGLSDPDGDGVPALRDDDSDGDGLLDALEGEVDTDGDGVSDFLDLDSDGDGLLDSLEGEVDTDGDGVPDFRDSDSDGDGDPDVEEGTGDVDCDGLPDWRDADDESDFCDDGQPTPAVDTGRWGQGRTDGGPGLSGGSFTGGACSTASGTSGWLGVVLLALVMRRRRAVVVALGLPTAALAQDVDVQRFVPSPGSGLLTVHEARLPEAVGGAELWLDAADEPLVYRGRGGDELPVVSRVTTARLAAWGRLGPVWAGTTLPVHIGVVGLSPSTGPVMGDATLAVRTSAPIGPVNVGAASDLRVPTGAPERHVGAGRVRVGGAALGSVALGPALLSVTTGLRTGAGSLVGSIPVGPALTWGSGVSVATSAGVGLSVELEGERWLTAGAVPGARPTELLTSVSARSGPLRWRLGGGAGVSRGIGAPDWRVVAGLAWESR